MDVPQTNADLGERKDSWPVMIGGGILVFALMIFVFPRIMKMIAAPYEDRAHEHLLLQSATHLKKLEGKLVAFHGAYGRYPSVVEDLDVLLWNLADGPEPDWGVSQRQILADSWGRPIHYVVPAKDGQHPFDLRCFGRDGLLGGEGANRDISTWDWGSSVEAPWPDRPGAD